MNVCTGDRTFPGPLSYTASTRKQFLMSPDSYKACLPSHSNQVWAEKLTQTPSTGRGESLRALVSLGKINLDNSGE